MQRLYKILTLVSLLGVVAVVSYNLGKQKSAKVSEDLNFSLLYTVKDKLEKQFLEKEKLDPKLQTYGAIKGYVEALGDPYTVFLPPTENKLSEDDLKGEFGGVGISLGFKDNRLAVMTPIVDTPAAKAGIVANDLILKIVDKNKNVDKDTTGISLQEAVSLIRGEIGTEVSLSVFREGFAAPKDFLLKRDTINVPAVTLEWKTYQDREFALVSLNKFSENLYEEWPKIVNEVLQKRSKVGQKMGGIVLDLRNNPGGYLESAVMVASDFVQNAVVVSQEQTGGKKTDYKTDPKRGKLLNEKLVVLINGGSASASEILAGALRELVKSKLIGEKSFGKGTVQIPENFADGSGLHTTIAKWLLPNGKNIHKVGVEPDVAIKWDTDPKKKEDLEKVFDELLK